DASSGFGGYRESGFGREGGREGLYEYVQRLGPPRATGIPGADAAGRAAGPTSPTSAHDGDHGTTLPTIDRTPKLYIGGKQARPDSGYSRPVYGAHGQVI